MSPRWYDKRAGDYLALDTGGGPIARLWATALAGLVNLGGLVESTGHSVKIRMPKTATKPAVEFEWDIPKWSNAIERNRARTYFQAYSATVALHCMDKVLAELHSGHTKTWSEFTVPKVLAFARTPGCSTNLHPARHRKYWQPGLPLSLEPGGRNARCRREYHRGR